MTINWRSISWSAAALLLLLTLATPLNFVTIFLVMTPFVVLYSLLNVKSFAIHAIGIGLVAFLLSGAYGSVVLTLGFFFLVPSIAIGHLYKRGKSAKTAIVVGFVIILAQLLLELALFSAMFDVNLKAELASMIQDSLKQLETGDLVKAGWATDTAGEFSDAIMNLLPMLLLLSAFLFTIVTHGLSRLSLRTVGAEAPALPRAKTWRVSRSLVLYYLFAMIASMAMSDNADGYWSIAISNLVPILRFAFTFQAIGFFFFLADAKKWPKAIPMILCVPLLLFPPLYLIGLIDAAFPLRKAFVK
ncbi:DUF2232 domain-containing protein [Cohnella endophytica]|uniref:DUF2232 domain-containing protein n=1 Tax=Cohnella endophytica TaxID=2419778 RepID=UPI001314A722|nr:DUF2232 domain-containing protein [Cohnella endophytica]